ncbi:MAG: calcium-translocating P-type ATPase, PMCA-type [Clostridiales bacterium]|nr:calcium-translocating P-type ATPase, PMCA-type [Clostridiales bacterium]
MWFNKKIEEVLRELNSDSNTGLSSSEAESRLNSYGENKLAEKPKKSLIARFFSQINDAMIYILFGASIISFIMGEVSDSIIILVVVIINALIGLIQESKAEKALEALKNMSTPKAIVKRNGEIIEISSLDVVIGDIVIIDAGRYIPADLRLIESSNLTIDESAFTGESVPASKDASNIIADKSAPIGDRTNMVYMSTLATYGRGVGIVVATGMDTEIGSIFQMIDEEKEESTPLQKKLSTLGKQLGIVALVICALIFIISIFQGRNIFEMLLTSISLAVAAIPEGLPAIVAIVLALGVQRMIKENAIVKKLPAVETLGSVNIICSDKTGTLTLNVMTVKKAYVNDTIILIEDININKFEDNLLIEGMVLCNDATSSSQSKTGDPTEIALIEAGIKYNINKDKLNSIHKRVHEIPFDSDRKLMTTVNSFGNVNYVFTKGALDCLLNICTKISINGEVKELTKEIKNNILIASEEMSKDALRVLALGYKEITKDSKVKLEDDLIFIGFMAMIDPPRKEVKPSINLCKKAGITPVMITGDHKNTAFAIGKELGICSNINECMSGNEIDSYNQEEFNSIIDKFKIFARVSPMHKVKIVKAFKSKGNIVSMTGDGVNDAPSLKAADIGVAMGITGTDVAKGAADMILTDDNFSTIVNAIEEGRNIYNNIKKSIIFLLACNLGEIIALFFAIVLNWPTPLLPIHILWVNLITDSFPALSLGVEKADKSVMNYPPRNPKESLFSGSMGLFLVINGFVIGFLTLFAFKIGESLYPDSLSHAQTIAFIVLALSQLFFSLNMRNNTKSIITMGPFSNKYLSLSIILGILVQVLIVNIDFLAKIFKVYSLTFKDWIFIVLISMIPLIINELIKIYLRKKQKNPDFK